MKTKNKIIKLLASIFAIVIASTCLFACGTPNPFEQISSTLSNYEITATLTDDKKFEVTADLRLTYVNNYDIELNQLMFHLYPNAYREGAKFAPVSEREIPDAYPLGLDYGNITISSVALQPSSSQVSTPAVFSIGGSDQDILIVELGDYLLPTHKVVVMIGFTVSLPQIRHRLGYSDNTINLGNWYPIACVFENGAFNIDPYYSIGDPFYSQVANYNVSFTVPNEYVIASSGDLQSNPIVSTKGSTHNFVGKNIRDFALVMSKEFKVKAEEVDGIKISYYYRLDTDSASSLKAAKDSILTFNDKFGKYPYKSLAVVETPFLHGGMEYPNLVYISNREKGEMFREVIIHEIAHQWWYGVVGNDQVRSSWLDEGLTEYSTTMFYEFNPEYKIAKEKRIADTIGGYLFYCDLTEGTIATAMNKSINEYRDSMNYTFMTYVKGQLMMDSLRRVIGDKKFFVGLQSYYTDRYMKIARPEHFIGAMETSSGMALESFFDSWVSGRADIYGSY